MKSATRLTSKGQVVIPKPVRDHLAWRAGTRLRVEVVEGDALVLRREGPAPGVDALIDELSGCLAGAGRDPLRELEADHRAEIEADERSVRRRR